MFSTTLAFAVSLPSEVTAGRKRRCVEGWLRSRNHRGDRDARGRARREADVLMTERQPETGMPWRPSDHRQAVGQRRPRAAPGFADRLAEFDHAARDRDHRIELSEG